MNVLYHFRTRGFGAEAVHISGIADALENAGHHVIFSSPTGIDPRENARTSEYKDTAHRGLFAAIAKHSPRLLFELLELFYNLPAWNKNRRILQSRQIGLIYERHAFFLFSTGFLARKHRIPFIVEVNELVGDPRVRAQPILSSLVRACDRAVFTRADLVVVVSPHLKRRVEELGIDPGKVLVLPNAVSARELENTEDGKAVRASAGISDKTVIGFVGWLGPWHKIETLVETVADLARTRPNVHLLLVGEGELTEPLRKLAADLRISDRVTFTGGIGRREIPRYIAAMDICVVPHSNAYRSPIKLFEYMAAGRPVVAPATEPIASVVDPGVNGVLFPPGDASAMKEALAGLLDSPDRRKEIGAHAREAVRAHYTWERNVERMLAAMEGVRNAGLEGGH